MKRHRKIRDKKVALMMPTTHADVIKVVFPYSVQNIEQVRTIEGRKWVKKDKYWTVPLSLDNALLLKGFGYTIRRGLKEWANNKWIARHRPKQIDIIPGLKKELFEFQKQGVGFLEIMDGRGLIADEMGLGKTVQALAWLQLNPTIRPAVIICPASLKLNWESEAHKWINVKNIQILSGKKPDRTFSTDINIINFDIISYWVNSLLWLKPKVVIIDETQYINNNSSKRTEAVKQLCKIVPHIIGLSGAPIENKTSEIYNIVHILDNSIFPDKWKFLHRYCNPKHNGYGWAFDGSTNSKELYNILTDKVMIRRKKADVLKDLPDKIYSFIPFEIDNKKEYEKAEDDFIAYVQDNVEIKLRKQLSEFMDDYGMDVIQFDDHKLERLKEQKAEKATPLVQLEILKQLAVKGKLKQAIDWIFTFLESGEKLIVFTTHVFVIEALEKHFKKICVKIDGSVSAINRQKAQYSFQTNKKIKLFLGNIYAAGVGLTLTAASNVVLLEYPWTPGKLNQAIDRAHRITQKFTVNVYFLIGKNTIDEKIAKLLHKKQKNLDAVLDGKDVNESNILSELINEFKYK